jgi:hypothetical protein
MTFTSHYVLRDDGGQGTTPVGSTREMADHRGQFDVSQDIWCEDIDFRYNL